MDIFREQMDRIVYEQRNLLEVYTNEYSYNFEPDDGSHLVCCKNNGKATFYRANRENGKRIRKSLSKDPDAIRALARKEYLRIVIPALKNNVDVLDTSIANLKNLDFESIMSQMSGSYRRLPEECFFANEVGKVDALSGNNEDRFRRHREWANEPYEKSDYKPELRKFMTSAGFKVRSKSEQHIVEQLVIYGVPFRYEQVIHINERSYSADFTFRDSNGGQFYWEHAGMMDVPNYVDAYHRKMDVFERIGIVPWKNLIITYDIDGVISVPLIKSVIEYDVIPRL